MGSGVRARFLPSPALLHGGWDVGCCRIGLAASAGFEEPELTFPCRCGARGGACLVGRLPPLPLACFSAPLPRRGRISPLPPSPAGKGEIQGYFMQGASPLASPGQNPRGTGKGGKPRARRGGCLVWRPPTPPLVYFFAPIPPTPFPGGEGGSRLFHARGFAPCIPRAEPGRHLHDQRFLFVYGGAVPAAKERGDRGRGTSAFEMVLSPGAGRASAANGLMQGCRGRSPRRNKVKISPFPGGEGGRGDRGQKIKLTAG